MDHRRFVTFLVFFFAFTYLYNAVIVPKFFPPPPKPPAVAELPGDEPAVPADPATDDDSPAAADSPDADSPDADSPDADSPDAESRTPEIDDAPAEHPRKMLEIGSLDPTSGFMLYAELTTQGAAVESVQLTDPRFRELSDRERQVTVVGNNATDDRTFSTAVSAVDEQLKKHRLSLETIDWEVVSAATDHVVFAFEPPDHSLRVEKSYRLTRVDVPPKELKYEFRNNSPGHTIEVELTVKNLSDAPRTIDYELQGPVGVILENREHTRKYRDIKLEFLGEDSDVTLSTKEVSGLYQDYLAEAQNAGRNPTEADLRQTVKQKDPWTGAFRYAGVDVQFFAALVAPLDERDETARLAQKWIDRTYPVMIDEDRVNVYESDISFRIASTPQQLEAAGAADSVTHRYAFFVGPKRSALLDPPPLEADRVLDYGTGLFSFFGLTGMVARLMHFLLNFFHGWGLPYGLCIICLTVLVRGCMFPISRKQALSAARMKELQPRLNELKLKYADDKQKLAQAQMELWRKHNINPLSGCMPLLFQMPIFIGLYSCLNTAVDLRLSSFLWIDNLAAPDALFNFPFATPAIVGPHISVLPLVTVVLFLIQQKMFMPPPADEQAEMTQKMMNMMTFMFGALFWHQPAGLCVYFICSSLWGIAERKLLGMTKAGSLDESSVKVVAPEKSGNGKKKTSASAPQAEKKQGFFSKLMEAAEEAQKQAEKTREKQARNKGKRKGR
ncbi:MAG: membrane protein insertase YidC [Fuerstiella sp.]